MPKPIQLTRLGRGLARLFGLQGQLSLSLLDDITPIVVALEVEDYARGELPFGVEAIVGPIAAQFGFLQLANPAGSRSLLKVDAISSAGNGVVRVGPVLGAVGGVAVSAQPRDGRMLGIGRSVAFTTSGTNAAAILGAGGAFANLTFETVVERGLAVLSPGSALIMEASVVNAAIDCSIQWREIPLAPQELSP